MSFFPSKQTLKSTDTQKTDSCEKFRSVSMTIRAEISLLG